MSDAQVWLVTATPGQETRWLDRLTDLGFGAHAWRASSGGAWPRKTPPDALLVAGEDSEDDLLPELCRRLDVPVVLACQGTGSVPGKAVYVGTEPTDEELRSAIHRAISAGPAAMPGLPEWTCAAVAASGEGVVAADADGRVVALNPVAQRMTGWLGDQAVGQPVADVVPVETESGRTLAPAPASQATFVSATLRRSDDTRLPVTAKRLALPGETGGTLWVLRDVSERRRAEQRLIELEKMETIGRLAGGIAHHFNNLLTVIMGNAQLLQADPLAVSDLPDTLDQMLEASRQAADLTSHLLAFARVGPGHVTSVDLHQIVRKVTDVLEQTIDRRIRIRQDLTDEPAVVTGDPAQLQNAVVNLALNARDAMPDGGTLTFRTRVVTVDDDQTADDPDSLEAGTYAELAVVDDGVGMSADTLLNVFEPFFTTKETGRGLGLGLASVYASVLHHGGTVKVDSTPARGTTVRLLLPVAPTHLRAEPAPHRAAAPAAQGHILVVDDEPTVSSLVARVLKRNGYRVSICADGAEAVEFYKTHGRDVDLVILDLVMPEMDGREAFRQLKAIDPKVKALLSSGYGPSHVPKGLLEDGILGFLPKPYQIEDLSETVHRYLTT